MVHWVRLHNLNSLRLQAQNSRFTVHSMDLSGHGGAAFQAQFGIEQLD